MSPRYILSAMASHLLGGAMVGAALLSLAFPAAAQDKVGRVGLLSNGNPMRLAGQPLTWRDAVLLSLDQNGYRLGLNLELVDRHSEGHVDRLPGLAQEIASTGVDVVVAVSDPSVRAMLAATQATPIVMVVGTDPVTAGFVANFARPGGRVTGLAFQVFEGDAKRRRFSATRCPTPVGSGGWSLPGNPRNIRHVWPT
jgi:putative ABC transport system substrate-binding protein